MRPVLIWLAGLMSIVACRALADCPLERVASLPLLPGDHPLIQVSINGKPVQMVIDTGATATTVTPEASEILGLRPDPARRSRSSTVGGEDLSRNAILDTLSIGELTYKTYSVAVLPLAAKGTGLGLGGLIGADILSSYDIELDFPKRTLTLYRSGFCVPARPSWNGEYSMITGGSVNRHRFLFPVELNGHSVIALFDTGARAETITRSVTRRIGISDDQLNNDPAGTGMSAGLHPLEIRRHRFDTFKIGAETFHDVRLDVVESRQPGLEMLVGVDYMRTRRFFLSWPAATLYVQREPAAPAGDATRDPCRPPPDMLPGLAHTSLVAVNRPRFDAPARAVADRIDGCVGVIFHLTADGAPTDVRPVTESPAGYDLAEYVVHEVSSARFFPNPAETKWYYEVHRIHPKPAR